MANITEKQGAVLLAVLTNDYNAFNGGKPAADYTFCASDWDVWSNDIDACAWPDMLPKGKALSGTVGQLVQAGLLKSDGQCVRFTEAGYKLARELDPR